MRLDANLKRDIAQISYMRSGLKGLNEDAQGQECH